jgi:hypothetical protein
MRDYERAKANALKLRREGLSISQIAQRLDLPRWTVGGWVRGYGEWYEIRQCRLCGERFIARSGSHRFCTPAHAERFRRERGRVIEDPPDEATFALACELADQLAEQLQREAHDDLAA